jgi:hypothetical protein
MRVYLSKKNRTKYNSKQSDKDDTMKQRVMGIKKPQWGKSNMHGCRNVEESR